MMLKALKIITKHLTEARLLIVGAGPLRHKLTQISRKLGIANGISPCLPDQLRNLTGQSANQLVASGGISPDTHPHQSQRD